MQPAAEGTQKRCIRFLRIGILVNELRHLIPEANRKAHERLEAVQKLAAEGVAEEEGRRPVTANLPEPENAGKNGQVSTLDRAHLSSDDTCHLSDSDSSQLSSDDSWELSESDSWHVSSDDR